MDTLKVTAIVLIVAGLRAGLRGHQLYEADARGPTGADRDVRVGEEDDQHNDCCDTRGAPYLFIGIGMVPNNHCNGYAATVHLELRQVANLERDTELSYHAPTWTRGQTIVVEEQSAAQEVQKLLRSWINMFIYDYKSVNRENNS